MERYCTKEGTNDEKVKFSLQSTSILENTVCKTATKQGLAVLLTLQNASGEPSFGSDKILSKTKQWVGVFPSRIYARAFHRILLFLLSQVSQLSHRPLLFSHQPRCFTTSKTTRRSKRNNTSLFQNDTSFYVKWVLILLMRRFIFRGYTHFFEALFRQKQAISLMEHKITPQ